MSIFLKQAITNNLLGANQLIRNQDKIQRMLNPKLELQNQELIIPPLFINQKKAELVKSTFSEDMVVSTMKEKLFKIFTALILKPLNGLNLNQVVNHLLCQILEVVTLLLLWRINHKFQFLEDGPLHPNILIFLFMISQRMNGLTQKSLTRSQNGTMLVLSVIPSHLGNISSLEVPQVPLKKEENVLIPNMLMTPLSLILIEY